MKPAIFPTEPSACLACFAPLCSEMMKTQQPLHVATPVRQSLALTKVAGTSVYLKLDSSQPTGSFKIRGIGHLCKTVSGPDRILSVQGPLWGNVVPLEVGSPVQSSK